MVDKFCVADDHPSLQGHFPGNPIAPGVVILNEVIGSIEKNLTNRVVVGIKSVKFIKPIQAGREMRLHYDEKGLDSLNIVCELDGEVHVKGQLVLSSKEVV